MRKPTVVLADTGSDGLKYHVGRTSTRVGIEDHVSVCHSLTVREAATLELEA